MLADTVQHMEEEAGSARINSSVAGVACKMAKVMGLLKDIPKTGYHAQQQYWYHSGDDIYGAIRKAMAEANLALFVTMRGYQEDAFTNSKGTKGTRTTVGLALTLLCGDTGQSLTADWTGVADTYGESSEKGVDKAASLGQKSWLKKTFLVSADEPENKDAQPRPRSQPRQSTTRDTQSDGNGKKAGDDFKTPPWWNVVMGQVIRPCYDGNQQHATNSIKKLLSEHKLTPVMAPEFVVEIIQAHVRDKQAQPE